MEKSDSTETESKDANWEFHPEAESSTIATDVTTIPEHEVITWSASEFIAHHKDFTWFLTASLCTIAIACVVFFATDQSWFSSVLILVAGATFIFFAAQPPRTLDYTLDAQGLTIANKIYDYHRFKSFSIIHEGAFGSITLQPMERFMPSLTIYFEPKDEEKIAAILSMHLPYDERGQAHVEKLMRKIRF